MLTFLTIFSVLAVSLGTGLAWLEICSPMIGAALALGGVVFLAILFFVAFISFLKNGSKEANWPAILLGLVALISLGGLGYLFYMNPIRDVTSNVRNPPKFLHPAYVVQVEKGSEFLDKSLLIDREYQQANAATQLLKNSGFEGLRVRAPAKDVFEDALKLIKEQLPGWKLVMEDKAKFHAEFTMEWSPFRFVDDVVLEVRPDPHNEFDSTIDTRSRSRSDSPSDFGVNIFRLRDLKVRLLLAAKPLEDRVLSARVAWETKNAESTGKAAEPVTVPAPAPQEAKP